MPEHTRLIERLSLIAICLGYFMVNACRQVGGTLSVAVLGSLLSQRATFIPGMHVALAIAGGAFLLGFLLTLLFVHRGPTQSSGQTA